MAETGEVKITFKGDSKQVVSETNKVVGALNKVKATTTQASTGFVNFANVLKGVVYYSLVRSFIGGIKQVISESAKLEKALAGVKAVTGATAQGMRDISDAARNLSKDSIYSPSEIAKGFVQLSKSGYDVNEALEAMPDMLDLATAGSLDLTQAIKIGISALKGFKLETTETGRAADILVGWANKTQTSVQEVSQALKLGIPISQLYGFNIEEVVAVLAQLSQSGIQASMAGTTIRRAMASLLSPTKEVEKLMAQYNITLEDTTGRKRGLLEITDMLRAAQIKERDLVDILKIRGLGFANVLQMTTEEYEKFKSVVIETGVAHKTASIMSDNTTDNLKKLANSVNAAAGSFVESFNPAIKWLLDGDKIGFLKDIIVLGTQELGKFAFAVTHAGEAIRKVNHTKMTLTVVDSHMANYIQLLKDGNATFDETVKKISLLKKSAPHLENFNEILFHNAKLKKLNLFTAAELIAALDEENKKVEESTKNTDDNTTSKEENTEAIEGQIDALKAKMEADEKEYQQYKLGAEAKAATDKRQAEMERRYLKESADNFDDWVDYFTGSTSTIEKNFGEFLGTLEGSLSTSFGEMIKGTKSWEDGWKDIGDAILDDFIKMCADILAEWILNLLAMEAAELGMNWFSNLGSASFGDSGASLGNMGDMGLMEMGAWGALAYGVSAGATNVYDKYKEGTLDDAAMKLAPTYQAMQGEFTGFDLLALGDPNWHFIGGDKLKEELGGVFGDDFINEPLDIFSGGLLGMGGASGIFGGSDSDDEAVANNVMYFDELGNSIDQAAISADGMTYSTGELSGSVSQLSGAVTDAEGNTRILTEEEKAQSIALAQQTEEQRKATEATKNNSNAITDLFGKMGMSSDMSMLFSGNLTGLWGMLGANSEQSKSLSWIFGDLQGIMGSLGSTSNWAGGMLGGLIGAIGKLGGSSDGGTNIFRPSTWFAEGGVATRPTLAMFAEAETEVALPLSKAPEILAQTLRLSGGVGSGVNVYFSGTNLFTGSEYEMDRLWRQGIKKAAQRSPVNV